MAQILVARIDDRLIHGQVVTAWVRVFPITDVLIVDDELARNDMLQRIYQAAAPEGLNVTIMATEQATVFLQTEADESARFLVLAKTPMIFEALIAAGIPIAKVVLGGIGAGPGRKTLIRNISANPAERDCLQRLLDRGILVNYQMLPSDREVDISAALRKAK